MAGPTKKAAAAAVPAAEAIAVSGAATPPGNRGEPLAASGSTWSITYRVTALVLVFAAAVLLLRLADQERGGPAHDTFSIGDGLPATLYLPVDAEDDGDFPSPPPKGQRPPVVVMAHGYSSDRASMSGMARSLAEAGYAVLSIDLRGHGANTDAFRGDLRDDFRTAVDWAATSPYVDGERLAVLGHSMGAGAALDFATTDDRPRAVVPVSGGWAVNDAVVPDHTLFLVADGDPGRIADRQAEMAAELAARGGDVRSMEITGSDHLRILRDDDTIAAITGFLDPVLGVERGDGTPGLVDPRMNTAVLYVLVVLGLVALLGLAIGQAAPDPANASAAARAHPGAAWIGFAVTAAALAATLPLLAAGGFDLLPLGAGQPILMHLGLAGAVLWAGRALARRGQVQGRLGTWLGDGRWLDLRAGGWPGLAAGAAIVTLLLPLSGVFHRMVPTPERAVYWVLLTIVIVPFFAAFEALLRRGRTTAIATVGGVLGKVLLLVTLALGLGLGALPPVIALIAPLFLVQYVLLEIFAATVYARGRNTTLIGIADAVVLAFMAVTLTPVG